MGKKAKEGSVNLYYLKNQNDRSNKSVSKPKNSVKKNTSTQKKTNNKTKLKTDENIFNFDDEIVIGVTKIKDNKTKSQNKVKKQNVKDNKNKPQSKAKKQDVKNTKKVQAKNKVIKEKKKKNFKIFKYIFITCAIAAAIICFLLSPIFNLSEVKIIGNNKVSPETILSFSDVKIGENIFKINKFNIISKIKQNAYIEEVNIKRKLPTILEIDVKERVPTYMLEYVNSFAYINNQGYMLEISDDKINKPTIIGISTNPEDIKPGNRLAEADLLKLESVLKIMESATSNDMGELVTKIDISDKLNYKLYMETEGKTVILGDTSDIATKMLHVKKIIEKEAGIEGEIIVDSVAKDSKSRFIQKINWSEKWEVWL